MGAEPHLLSIGLVMDILFFGPCIFNMEDQKNQKKSQINSGLIYY